MSGWVYFNPTKITAAAGFLDQLPQLISSERWLLVTTAGFSRRGLTERIQKRLPMTEFLVYDQVTSNPELDELENLTQQYRSQGIKGILAVGGGSVLDAAKVLAVTLPSQLQTPLVTTLRQGHKCIWPSRLPLIVVPTTSGTGAEVTPFATVWDATEHKKYSVTGDQIYPDHVLLDAELTVSLPEQETLYTGLDAISHALESIWNINRSPVSRGFAIQALELAEQALIQVLHHPSDIVARKAMQEASLLAGMAISQTRTAIAHSISYPLTSHYGIPHGLACSFTLPRLIQVYLSEHPFCPERFLFQRLLKILESLKLDDHIAKYANKEQILALKDDMHHPDRAGNFIVQLGAEGLASLILR